jgi:hypothetical protein
VQERTPSGALLNRIPAVPASAFWVPGSHSHLLFFRQNALWRWSPSAGAQLIVSDAHGIRGYAPLMGVLAAKRYQASGGRYQVGR